jgi:hypothetical protein
MTLSPVPGSPGIFHDSDTGRPLNIREFSKFETSERMEGVGWHSGTAEPFKSSDTAVIHAWRLTCAKWPDPETLQQKIELRVQDKVVSSLPLFSILTVLSEPLPEVGGSQATVFGRPTSDSRPFRMLRDRDLSAEKLSDVVVKRYMLVSVVLTERPVEGAGLRLHLRGMWRSRLPG